LYRIKFLIFMKIGVKVLLLVAVASLGTGCRDRAIEKRLADVESRLAQLEGNKNSSTPSTVVSSSPAPADVKPEGPLPVIEFDKTSHDFGSIKEGDKVSHTYQVKNTGQAPLIIQSASPSCGCTVPDWTKEPIAPGGTGYVKAEFDSKGKAGVQDKSITVTANTWPKVTVLKFKALVGAKPTGANGPTVK
jgi:hypothetical protein